jgi:hypothetical protein
MFKKKSEVKEEPKIYEPKPVEPAPKKPSRPEKFDRVSLDDFAIAAMQSIILVKSDTLNPIQLSDRAYALAHGMMKKSREITK